MDSYLRDWLRLRVDALAASSSSLDEDSDLDSLTHLFCRYLHFYHLCCKNCFYIYFTVYIYNCIFIYNNIDYNNNILSLIPLHFYHVVAFYLKLSVVIPFLNYKSLNGLQFVRTCYIWVKKYFRHYFVVYLMNSLFLGYS